MNGGLASPAARQSAVPESPSRSRPESASRAPVREPPAALTQGGERARMPTTRERMQASFGASGSAGPPARGSEAIRVLPPIAQPEPTQEIAAQPALAVVPPAADALTTRDRIVNRALADQEAARTSTAPAAVTATAPAVVVDIAEVQDRRRQRQPDSATAPPGPEAPLAPVIALVPKPQLARPPPPVVDADVAPASTAPATAESEAKPAVSAAAAALEPEAGPEAAAPESTGPETSPTATATAPAAVVDIAEVQDRRRQRQPEGATAPPGPDAPLAPVIALVPKPQLARPPPPVVDADVAPASTAPATAESEATPAVSAPGALEPEAGPEAGGAPARAGPEAGPEGPAPESAGPETSPTAVAALRAEPSGDGASPQAESEAAQPTPDAPQGAVAPQPAVAGETAAAPAVAPTVIRNPEDEPGFQAMKERARRAGVRAKDHQPGVEGAATAQGASEPDARKDVDSQVADDHVEAMGEKEPGPFDAAKFKVDVKAAIEGMAPPATLEEADEFEELGKAGQATGLIHTLVTGGKAVAEHDIKATHETVLDPSVKTPKPVSKMVNDAPGPPLPDVGAAAALPGRRPPEQTDLSAGPLEVDAKMVEANVTEEQLASANEPDFTAALDARQEVRDHAATHPGEYRTQEELVLARGRAEAESVAAAQLEGMHGARTGTLGAVLAAKEATKLTDQQVRDDIHQSILDIHERTQADVKALLGTLDTTVETIFTEGEKAARKHFEEYVDQKMRAYKADRYGGWFGDAYWLKDRFFDLPDEVNDFYRDGRADYLAAMDVVIDLIAAVVGMLLGAAQLRIQAGREEVRTFVTGLDDAVRKLGEDTAEDLDHRFDQLSSDVDAKRDELVDTVARKYVESRDELDTRIKELQEANKGLVSKAIDAVVGVLKTIYELGKLLLRVLLKAAAAIGDIIAHPIRFLGNLIDAVKGGLDRFVSRIGVHLQESLLDLLFGELGRAGITMPKQLDFAGILDLVLQVLGLTYQSIRERVVKRFGEPVVARMEQTVDVFTTLAKDGVAGLWVWIRDKLADLEDLVIGELEEYIVERVVKAGSATSPRC